MHSRINLAAIRGAKHQELGMCLDEISDKIGELYSKIKKVQESGDFKVPLQPVQYQPPEEDVMLKKRTRLGSTEPAPILDINQQIEPDEEPSDEEVNLSAKEIDEIRRHRKANPLFQGCNSIENYLYIKKINKGAYGIVFKAKEILTGQVCAIKKITLEANNMGFPVSSLREISILMGLDHQNIIKIKEVVTGDQKDKIYVVLEYMDFDLKTMLFKLGPNQLNASHVKCLMKQLIEGVSYMHRKYIIHRDLKTSNLLVNSKGELKICDFGLGRSFNSHGRLYSANVVTLWYRAPELLLPPKTHDYNEAIDMWSVGCIMAEIILGKPLFPGSTELEQLDLIFKTMGVPSENIWPGVGQLLKNEHLQQVYPKPTLSKLKELFTDVNTNSSSGPILTYQGFQLLSSLLEFNPKSRLTAKRALQHPWFKEDPQECPIASVPQPSKTLRAVARLPEVQTQAAAEPLPN